MVCKLLGVVSSFFSLTISCGLSNMLSDRRNCFLGRTNGLEGLREWLPIGDPLTTLLDTLENGLLSRGGGAMLVTEVDAGRRSRGGDSMKHSSKDIDVDVDNLLLPAPKRKGGNWLSTFCRGRVLVE